MPSPSPTIIRAVKLKRRPPLTTLATRLIVTSRSMYGVLSWAAPPRPPSRRSPRAPVSAPDHPRGHAGLAGPGGDQLADLRGPGLLVALEGADVGLQRRRRGERVARDV